MAYNPQNVELLRDKNGLPIPQYYDDASSKMKPLEDPRVVKLAGSILAESTQTEADAVSGVLTFSKNISEIEIYNNDPTNAGVFNVNGFDITIPAGAPPFLGKIGGTPRATVNVSGSTSYVVGRYE